MRRIAAAASLAVCASAAGAAPVAAGPEGVVSFELHARPAQTPLVTSDDPSEQDWMRDHYESMRGYAPFFDQALDWAPPASFYQDLYALYPHSEADLELIEEHPEFVLRDAAGHKLYIPFACEGGTCPAWAADVGNPQWRAEWIERAQAEFDKGYVGVFIDNVLMEMKVSDGWENLVAPIDPRTGQPMTETSWRLYVAEFVEEIRAAFPDKGITHNTLWWMDHSDPYVQREIAAADYVEMERGFNDQGLTYGGGQWGYETYLAQVDWLHSQGAGVVFEPYGLDAQSAMFEIASYFLVSNGNDSITSEYRVTPDDWWAGWEADLGEAQAARYTWHGLIRRDFDRGIALINQPGAPTRTIQLPSDRVWKDLDNNTVTSVTLRTRRGAVLTSEAPAPSDPPPGDPPPPEQPQQPTGPASPAPSSGGGQTPAPAPSGSQQPPASQPSGYGPAPTIKVHRTKVKRGRRVVVSGEATATSVEIRGYIDGGWQVVSSDETIERGSYRVVLRMTEAGTVELKTVAPGLPESSMVSIKVKG